MPATITETNTTPLNTIDVDSVTVDIIENALKNAREEMDAVLFRTAMSPGIREQGDCFPMIANREGKMVVGQFGSFIGPFMEAYNDDIEEGDIILTNDDRANLFANPFLSGFELLQSCHIWCCFHFRQDSLPVLPACLLVTIHVD